jgi:hypothetical protein
MNSKNEGEVGFIKEAKGPQGLFAVFQDDGVQAISIYMNPKVEASSTIFISTTR